MHLMAMSLPTLSKAFLMSHKVSTECNPLADVKLRRTSSRQILSPHCLPLAMLTYGLDRHSCVDHGTTS